MLKILAKDETLAYFVRVTLMDESFYLKYLKNRS